MPSRVWSLGCWPQIMSLALGRKTSRKEPALCGGGSPAVAGLRFSPEPPGFNRRVRASLLFILRYLLLPYCLMASVPYAFALTAQEIYREAERSVFVLEILDQKGGVVSSHTAMVLEQGTAVAQCDLLEGAAAFRLRSGDAVFPAKIEHRDSGRNLCLLGVPGVDFARRQEVTDTDPDVGAQVYAVSNTLGLGISIAEGVVSGIRKSRGESFIQHTAAIAPGSEGGACSTRTGGWWG